MRGRAGLAAISLVAACGDGPVADPQAKGRDGGKARDGGAELPGFDLEGGAGAGSVRDCSDEAKLVYVVSQEHDLYSFQPRELRFTRIGRLACAAGAATPNSMAVDRAGTAWVNYSDGRLFRVSTKDASCAATAFQPGQAGFGAKLGMGFSSDAAGSAVESLFVSDIGGGGLGRLDVGTLTLARVGDYSGTLAGRAAELTGTGDGRLYGFFTTAPASLAQITKPSAATDGPRPLAGVSTGSAWAFSFWGGDFWFYTAGTEAEVSRVTRLASATGDLSVAVPSVGFRIVGAGVSTCAPLTAPK